MTKIMLPCWDSKSWIESVFEFNLAFKRPINVKQGFPSDEIRELQMRLLTEEVQELIDAEVADDFVKVADGLGDILYVIIYYAMQYGIDINKVFKEIHRSNMTKLGLDGQPIFNEYGKVLKGPNYDPPNLKKVLDLE